MTQSDPKKADKTNEQYFSLKNYLRDLFDISTGTNKAGTIKDIKDGISMKGHNAWILIFSILIASVGLNVSSTAVVIGAMLISPLMGPILGLGMSIAINDVYTLRRSLVNLGTMVAISIITSFLFFSIPLFQEETPEILARTAPDLRDVLIAISGGLALIVAISRRSELTNTIAGVAIATALMPPLCTAGYGLAVRNLHYFGGAFFLFIINSTFIALATFVILKFLNFRPLRHDDSARNSNIARVATFVALMVFIGSIYEFYQLVREKQFQQKAISIINDVKDDGYSLIDMKEDNYSYKNKTITLTVFGQSVDPEDIKRWQQKMDKMGLKETRLIVHQNSDDSELISEVEEIRKAYNTQFELIRTKDEALKALEKQIAYNNIPLKQIADEARINYSHLEGVSFAREFKYNYKTIDTVVVISSVWDKENKDYQEQFDKFKTWVVKRLDYKSIEVKDDTPTTSD
ncbi:MAG: hypothetical protein CR968_00590 [Flavobacteriia bacterium]|nr:MAG: hypothetical protein CR968_00590 [Flavobacteriia bacterium]